MYILHIQVHVHIHGYTRDVVWTNMVNETGSCRACKEPSVKTKNRFKMVTIKGINIG